MSAGLVRLDLGCGNRKEAGWVGMDSRPLPGVDIVHDLEDFPWPLPDNSCSIVQASHVLEHVPPVGYRLEVTKGTEGGVLHAKDVIVDVKLHREKPILRFMDEAWRILAPGGQLWAVMPYGWSHGFVMDPTHASPFNEDTWNYFNAAHPLYKMYEPRPWKLVKVESQRAGNMLAVLEPIEKSGPLGHFAMAPREGRVWTDPEVANEFHLRWYGSRTREDSSNYCCNYGGRVIDKTPLDLWRYVELIEAVRPQVIIETGTANGASAEFFIEQMRRCTQFVATVVSIDIDDGSAPFEVNPSRSNPGKRPVHTGISYLLGSSTSQAIAMEAMRQSEGKRTMVVLDSDHGAAHVELEMNIYWPLVSPGSYMVVEDSNVNGHPVYATYGPGPHEAVARWLPDHPDAVVDERLSSRFMGVTANTWIRKATGATDRGI